MDDMIDTKCELQPGFVYHISEDFFVKFAAVSNLVKNTCDDKKSRPMYYCCRDTDNQLLWMVPMTTKIEKVIAIHDKQVAKYGESLGIVISRFAGKKCGFLLQNVFPVTEKYISHIHTKNNQPLPVSPKAQKEIQVKLKRIKQLYENGVTIVFTNIQAIETVLIKEVQHENI